MASKSSIKNQIEELNCYILEDSFDNFWENNWENVYNKFIVSVHNGTPIGLGKSERIIPIDIANDMLTSFFMMLCRNPNFDAMGVYTSIKKNLLYPVFVSMCQDEAEGLPSEEEIKEGTSYADELMTGIWY